MCWRNDVSVTTILATQTELAYLHSDACNRVYTAGYFAQVVKLHRAGILPDKMVDRGEVGFVIVPHWLLFFVWTQ